MFNDLSRYYDLLYRDKDYAGEAEYIHRILSRHNILKGDLLEFGSGTGKHGRLLTTEGYTVHGIELSSQMVAEAKLVPGFSCQQGDIANTHIAHQFDAVLSLFHVISYQISNRQLQLVFANAATHLNQGGLFIFDFWYSPAVYSQKPQVRVKRMADENIEVTRVAEPVIYPNYNRVDVNYTFFVRDLLTNEIHTLQETHSMRHFSLPEIDLLANVHGFKTLEVEEFLTGVSPSENTWSVCVVLKKIGQSSD